MITKLSYGIGYESGAVFSYCDKYRYMLWRKWNADKKVLMFLMMNPSTADEVDSDPTVERCIRRAHKMDFGALIVANVFAYRETDSKKLEPLSRQGFDIVGPENDHYIKQSCLMSDMVICAWGKTGNLNGRGDEVLRNIRDLGVNAYALKINADGSPQHPLYIGYETNPFIIGACDE